MKWREIIFQRCFQKLEKLGYHLAVEWKRDPGQPLPCDGHPTLCKYCHALRYLIKFHKLPPLLYINTKQGIYKCRF